MIVRVPGLVEARRQWILHRMLPVPVSSDVVLNRASGRNGSRSRFGGLGQLVLLAGQNIQFTAYSRCFSDICEDFDSGSGYDLCLTRRYSIETEEGEPMQYTADWYWRYALLNLAGWLLLFGILVLLANYMSADVFPLEP
jgi:hypothetical protein